MHYFKKNLGDYAKKAGKLSMLEHGAYTLLMDSCYDRERFPTMEEAIDWCWARTQAEEDAVRFVLRKFFTLENGVYVQARIAEEISAYQKNAEKNRSIATVREEKRRSSKRAAGEKAPTVHEPSPTVHEAPPEKHEAPPNQEPLTINQEPYSVTGVTDSGAVTADTQALPPKPPKPPEKSEAEKTRAELWSAGKSLLAEQGMPAKQCGTFVGALVKKYGEVAVVEAVRVTVLTRPADAATYLAAACQHQVGQRQQPNKQEALEARNRAIAHAWATSQPETVDEAK